MIPFCIGYKEHAITAMEDNKITKCRYVAGHASGGNLGGVNDIHDVMMYSAFSISVSYMQERRSRGNKATLNT